MTTEDRLRTHPKDRLAPSVQRVDLAAASTALRAEPHAPVAGHRQVALVRRGPVSIILFVFEKDGYLKEHNADGEVTIHVLSGKIEVTAGGETTVLGGGELISLAPSESHSLAAKAPSEMLLSICRARA